MPIPSVISKWNCGLLKAFTPLRQQGKHTMTYVRSDIKADTVAGGPASSQLNVPLLLAKTKPGEDAQVRSCGVFSTW